MTEIELHEKVGEMGTDIKWLVADAKNKNGYIKELSNRIAENEKDINKMKGGAREVNFLWLVVVAVVGWIMWFFGKK